MTPTLLLAFFASAVLLFFAFFFIKPLRGLLLLMLRTAFGWAALYILNLSLAFGGVSIGMNIASASIVGILGVPGAVLLLLVKFLF